MAEAEASPFRARTIAWAIVAGLLAFIAFTWLTAYAPKLKMRDGSGATALSKSAVGFYGLYSLAELSGRPVDLGMNERDWNLNGFAIVTIDADTDPARLRSLIATRRANADATTLYVLPKWQVMPNATNRKWVNSMGTLDPNWSPDILKALGAIRLMEGKLGKGARVHGRIDEGMSGITATQPDHPRFLTGNLAPAIEDDQGRTILARIALDGKAAEYVLADPDLLSNKGLKTLEGATAAIAIVDALRANDEDSVAFDLALNGGSNSRNLLQLMFEPPFLALTLAILVAAIMTGIHAFGRFGPAAIEPRAIPFGKRALADNAAVLIARAGAEKRLGDRYVTLTRDATAAALGASALDPEAQEAWLAGLPHAQGADFATLADAVRTAPNAHAMQAAARKLFEWRRDVTRDR